MDQQSGNKVRWLKPAANGTDDELIQSLTDTLPCTESLDADGLKQLEAARGYMAELFLRGISFREFNVRSPLYGFPSYPAQVGAQRHKLMGDRFPVYFSFWLLDKDPATAATAAKNLLLFREKHAGENAGYFKVLGYFDVDNTMKNQGPLDSGLTKHGLAFTFGLDQLEFNYAQLEAACERVAPKAQRQVRFAMGIFGQHEFDDFGKLSLADPRIPFGMTSEFVLFRNVLRRAKRQAANRT